MIGQVSASTQPFIYQEDEFPPTPALNAPTRDVDQKPSDIQIPPVPESGFVRPKKQLKGKKRFSQIKDDICNSACNGR